MNSHDIPVEEKVPTLSTSSYTHFAFSGLRARMVAGYYVIRSILCISVASYMLFAIEWRTVLEDPRISLFVSFLLFWMVSDALFHVHHFYWYFLLRTISAQIKFDGTTVTVIVPGKPEESFEKSSCVAFYPHRSTVVLSDGRHLQLPEDGMGNFERDLVAPWACAWWPEFDLDEAVAKANAMQRPLHYAESATYALGLALSLTGALCFNGLTNGYMTSAVVFIGFALAVPGSRLVNRIKNRRLIVGFPVDPPSPTEMPNNPDIDSGLSRP